MLKKDQKEKRKQELLHHLLEDPTQGTNKIAQKTGMNRRTIFQLQKDMEKDQTIWGYTTVVDEKKLKRVVYLLQFKTKPFTKEFADLIFKRLTTHEPEKHGVRILDVGYAIGSYDVLIIYSAPDHETARQYFEILRAVYRDHFLNEPIISQMNSYFVKNGKINPNLKRILANLIPKIPK